MDDTFLEQTPKETDYPHIEDNSKAEDLGSNPTHDRLRSLIERIERLESDKAEIQEDIKAVYAEAKSDGFDTKAMRQVVKDRKQSPDEISEFEAILNIYRSVMDGTHPDD